MPNPTAEQMREDLALCERATAGPWDVVNQLNLKAPDLRGGTLNPLSSSALELDEIETNFEFISAARARMALYIEECRRLRELEESCALALKACRAHHAWNLAEESNGAVSFDARMELCRYSQWLTKRALSLAGEDYSGVPHLQIGPGLSMEIGRCDEKGCEKLIDEMFELAARGAGEGEG